MIRFLRLRLRGRLGIEGSVSLGERVRFDVVRGGRVELGSGVRLGLGCRFHVASGAVVRVGPGVVMGDRCVITAHESVEIGEGARFGDEVVLIDFDHDVSDPEQPVRLQPLVSAPIVIGPGATLGPAASVLRGVTVGANAVVGARAVVTRDLPDGAHAEGVPARPA